MEAQRGKILYVLPKSNYFSQGSRGRVTHALGITSGLLANGVSVHLLSGIGVAEFGISPSGRLEISEVQALIEPSLDSRETTGDLACDKCLASKG